ncbi:hypothetical protein LPTSP3_g31340 [Leptospira kobayashii]|uniref:YokE-like PH domain-containing protein n=1 Tax=Leptospira kobayashii TaxID=1917830 RepID=A0ABN6KJV7_9LEPT|nr:PH domain-containing protein [Leptospira kobayashii]BDA80204.1 hypothetical protein LPTSP3_g31340 [Leptospira kobayashii]
MQTQEEVKTQIKTLIENYPSVSIELLYTYFPAFNQLHEILLDNELMKAYCFGNLESSEQKFKAGKWLIVCTDKRFLFLQKASLLFDLTHFDIKFEDLKSIKTKVGWFFAEMNLQTFSSIIRAFHIGKKDFKFFSIALDALASTL